MHRIVKKFPVVIALFSLLYAGASMADAIMRSQAMFADTIAEFYVEGDHVRLELEIGSNDVGAFQEVFHASTLDWRSRISRHYRINSQRRAINV